MQEPKSLQLPKSLIGKVKPAWVVVAGAGEPNGVPKGVGLWEKAGVTPKNRISATKVRLIIFFIIFTYLSQTDFCWSETD